MKLDTRDETIAQLHAFIEDRADLARSIISQYPKSYNHKSASKIFDDGWNTGFKRCLAELKRIADKIEEKE